MAAQQLEYCFLWIDWWATCQTKVEWAGWTQALFTLATLGGGMFAVWWEARQRRHEARSDTTEALLARFAVLRLVGGQWEAFLQSYELAPQDFARVQSTNRIALDLALAEGQTVELRDMPTEKCVEHLVQIRAAILGARKILDKAGTASLTTSEVDRMRAGQRTLMRGMDGLWEEAKRIRG